MTPSLVYATSGLIGAVVGAAAGTSGAPPGYVILIVPFGALLLVRRVLPLQALAVAALVSSLTWTVASLHARRADVLADLARDVPRCELAGHIHERLGRSGAVLSASVLCAGVRGTGRVYARVAAAPGTRVDGDGWLAPIGDADGFDEMRRRAGLSAEFHFEEVVATPPRGIAALAESYRASLRDALSDDAEGELALGLTIGETTRFSPRDTELLRAAGLSHLVAVSGSNVAIVLASIAVLFAWTSRRLRLTAAVAGLIAFVIVVGPEPSVLRAAAMGAVALAGLASGTRGDPVVTLLLAVIVLLILRPALVWSVGLHLSVAATAGIVLWSRPLEERLGGLPRLVRMPLAVTLAAQVAVAPVLVATFGTLSVIAPIANVLAAPVIAPATILSLVAGCLDPLTPLASVPAAGAETLCGWVLAVGRRLGSLEWAELAIGPAWRAPLSLAPLVVLLVVLRKRQAD